MGLFSFRRAKPFFVSDEQKRIVDAIRAAERATSGEIRLYVESHNPYMNPVDRAHELFFQFKMDKTEHRNGVLLYLAMKDRELALFADEGIYQHTGQGYWDEAVKGMIAEFKAEHLVEGIEACVARIGMTLQQAFPYEASTDRNELPDDIIFGK